MKNIIFFIGELTGFVLTLTVFTAILFIAYALACPVCVGG